MTSHFSNGQRRFAFRLAQAIELVSGRVTHASAEPGGWAVPHQNLSTAEVDALSAYIDSGGPLSTARCLMVAGDARDAVSQR